ncbi:MAG TPA: NAD(P)-dependent alcohol dehydrogenase [Allosphingosinicella sp.]|nr:NAD(P)-dependent alcohol dehydrogenase [Allosphingosinicella sp.]
MKTIRRRAYGSAEILRLEEVPVPVPGPREVLIRVRAASVNAMDLHLMRGLPRASRLFTGLARPKDPRLGTDLAGTVEAVGAEVKGFAPGDAVFGACRGAFALWACADESRLAGKPASLSFEQAAALPVAGLTALQGLRDVGGLRAGRKVLVIGAGGGVGSFAVQIARAMGAEVTGACSPRHVERVRALGAARVIESGCDPLAADGVRYDLIFDLVGNRAFSELRRLLAPDGKVAAAGIAGLRPGLAAMAGWAARTAAAALRSRFARQKLAFVSARVRRDDLCALAALVETGAVMPAISGRFPLEQAAEAVRAVGEGHAGGKVLILP